VRSLQVITVSLMMLVVAGCSSMSSSAPEAQEGTLASPQSCTSAVHAWSDGRGGADFQAAVGASFRMRAALRSGSRAKVSAEAQAMNSATRRADTQQLPACASGGHYRLAMAYWINSALDAMGGQLKATSSELAAGAKTIEAVPALEQLAPIILTRLSRQVAVSAPQAATPASTSAPPSPSAPPSSAAPTGCFPLSDEGTCYEPGEYCRDSDHGVTGVAGDGENITCEDNDGWRWEPV